MARRTRSISRLSRFGAIAITVIAFAAVPMAQSSAAPTAGTSTTYISVSKVDFKPGQTYTMQQVQQMESAANPASSTPTSKPSADGPPAARDSVITPLAVAGGFALYNPGYRRTTYIYDSNYGSVTELECSPGCVQIGKYTTQLHEYVWGGISKIWQLKLTVTHISGNIASDFSYWYGCAVNVSGADDHYCKNGADPSAYTEPMGSTGTTLYEEFENNSYANTEYPMVGFIIDWGQATGYFNFRGADVCANASTTKLCNTTGNGTGGTHTW